MSKSIVLTVPNWNTEEVKYMAPKLNDKGGKSINIISKQTNRALTIATPLMMTWGIADFVDEKGESDGKFSISLNYPNEEYSNVATDAFLKKVKEFENQLLDDAVKNSELWFGEEMSREVVKHMFFPILKYSKNKETKKTDFSKPPAIRAKVPNYGGKWNVEIYDPASNMIFPSNDPELTPIDFVPKLSNVACVLGVSQIWVGGKGWGCTLKLVQCIVKPREVVSTLGKCQIQLSDEDKAILDKDEPAPVKEPVSLTEVEDSDDEDEPAPKSVPEPTPAPALEPTLAPEPTPEFTPAPAPESTPEPEPTPEPIPVSKESEIPPVVKVMKKIVKKKVV
jgi:hypothetical protein